MWLARGVPRGTAAVHAHDWLTNYRNLEIFQPRSRAGLFNVHVQYSVVAKVRRVSVMQRKNQGTTAVVGPSMEGVRRPWVGTAQSA